MKELEKQVIKDLIEFYELYIKGANKQILQEKAERMQTNYISASPILSDFINVRVASLVDFYVDTGIPPPTPEKAKEIIVKLKKLNEELEN